MIGTERKKSKCYRLFGWTDRTCLSLTRRYINLPIADAFYLIGIWASEQKRKLK